MDEQMYTCNISTVLYLAIINIVCIIYVYVRKYCVNFEHVRLIGSRLVSAYFLSHNTIHSTSRTLFTGSAEQPLFAHSYFVVAPCQHDP